MAVEKAKAGYKTIGFDTGAKVEMVNSRKNYIKDVLNEDFEEIIKSGLLSGTKDFSQVASVDCVCICVPTPLDSYQQPDISYVTVSFESIAPYILSLIHIF